MSTRVKTADGHGTRITNAALLSLQKSRLCLIRLTRCRHQTTKAVIKVADRLKRQHLSRGQLEDCRRKFQSSWQSPSFHHLRQQFRTSPNDRCRLISDRQSICSCSVLAPFRSSLTSSAAMVSLFQTIGLRARNWRHRSVRFRLRNNVVAVSSTVATGDRACVGKHRYRVVRLVAENSNRFGTPIQERFTSSDPLVIQVSSRKFPRTTGCGQDQTRKNIASATRRDAGCDATKPAPLLVARDA